MKNGRYALNSNSLIEDSWKAMTLRWRDELLGS
jgi:hypothetical protein